MSTQPCSNLETRLLAFVDGRSPPAERRQLVRHLEECTACQQAVRRLRESDQALQLWLAPAPPDGLHERILERLVACPTEGRLLDFAAGALEPRHATEVELHLATCPVCREEVERVREVDVALDLLEAPAPPEHLHAGIMQRLAEAGSQPGEGLRAGDSWVDEALELYQVPAASDDLHRRIMDRLAIAEGCSEAALVDYLAGRTSRALEQHLQRCSDCRVALAALQQVDRALEAWEPMTAPAGLHARIMAHLRSEEAPVSGGASVIPGPWRWAGLALAAGLLLAVALLWAPWKDSATKPGGEEVVVEGSKEPGVAPDSGEGVEGTSEEQPESAPEVAKDDQPVEQADLYMLADFEDFDPELLETKDTVEDISETEDDGDGLFEERG